MPFHVSLVDLFISPSSWEETPPRMGKITKDVLKSFDETGLTKTEVECTYREVVCTLYPCNNKRL